MKYYYWQYAPPIWCLQNNIHCSHRHNTRKTASTQYSELIIGQVRKVKHIQRVSGLLAGVLLFGTLKQVALSWAQIND
jgi:hypothetical protein